MESDDEPNSLVKFPKSCDSDKAIFLCLAHPVVLHIPFLGRDLSPACGINQLRQPPPPISGLEGFGRKDIAASGLRGHVQDGAVRWVAFSQLSVNRT